MEREVAQPFPAVIPDPPQVLENASLIAKNHAAENRHKKGGEKAYVCLLPSRFYVVKAQVTFSARVRFLPPLS